MKEFNRKPEVKNEVYQGEERKVHEFEKTTTYDKNFKLIKHQLENNSEQRDMSNLDDSIEKHPFDIVEDQSLDEPLNS